MAAAYSDPYQRLANDLVGSMSKIAAYKSDKASYDKSFAVTILGINQKFTGDVPVDDRQNLITKYSIPETTEDGEPKYFTVKINGAYYVTSQNASFKLYDKVMAYLPNGDWSRMYLDYQSGGKGETITLPHNFISTEEPEEGMVEGDYWYEVDDNNDIQAKWQYLLDDETGELQWWLMFDVISGVGEDIGNHSERFNDYTDNASAGEYDHIEGKNNIASDYSYCLHIGGELNRIKYGKWLTVHGYNNKVTGYAYCGALFGANNEIVSGSWLTVSGYDNKITNSNGSGVIGQHNILTNADSSWVCGEYNTVSGDYCNVSGYGNTVSSHYNNVSGFYNQVSYIYNTVGGESNNVSGSRNGVFGKGNTVSHHSSLTCGDYNTNNAPNSIVCGAYADAQYSRSEVFVIGNGTTGNPNNSFYIKQDGTTYAKVYNTTGADYAEYMEWYIRNFAKQDRRGMLVSLRGDKITPAQGVDVIGIISSRPSVVGNAYEEHWHGKYKTDVFGDYILDENGERQLSEDYDPEKIYIPRSKRPEEWAVVGIVGRLVVCDNGYCEPGKPILALDGIAVPALQIQGESTPHIKNIIVLKRIDKNHIEVIIK